MICPGGESFECEGFHIFYSNAPPSMVIQTQRSSCVVGSTKGCKSCVDVYLEPGEKLNFFLVGGGGGRRGEFRPLKKVLFDTTGFLGAQNLTQEQRDSRQKSL